MSPSKQIYEELAECVRKSQVLVSYKTFNNTFFDETVIDAIRFQKELCALAAEEHTKTDDCIQEKRTPHSPMSMMTCKTHGDWCSQCWKSCPHCAEEEGKDVHLVDVDLSKAAQATCDSLNKQREVVIGILRQKCKGALIPYSELAATIVQTLNELK